MGPFPGLNSIGESEVKGFLRQESMTSVYTWVVSVKVRSPVYFIMFMHQCKCWFCNTDGWFLDLLSYLIYKVNKCQVQLSAGRRRFPKTVDGDLFGGTSPDNDASVISSLLSVPSMRSNILVFFII